MTATTVIAASPAEVRIRQAPSDTMSQEKTDANENRLKNRVVAVSAFFRPQRSANQPPTTEPRNIPTNDSEVT